MKKLGIWLSALILLALFIPAYAQAAQQEGKSTIEWNMRSFQEFREFEGVRGSDGAERHLYRLTYPRVKQLSNGELILFFQDGQVAWEIFYMKSGDGGKTWSAPRFLVEKQPVEGDMRVFTTADALELQNGWLVAAYSYRYNKGIKENKNNGIEVVISKDYGETWSEPIIAYRGANWEPSLLQLEDGELQLYYTQKGPYNDDPVTAVEVGMVRSYDNGLTWDPKVDGPPWSGLRLSQNDREKADSKVRAEDGMAVAVELQDGKGIVYVCETEHGDPTGPWVIWSDREKNWNYPEFTKDQFGPWDRRWLVHEDFQGYAPYMLQMDSGEVLVASNGKWKGGPSRFYVFVGDGDAKNFQEPTDPFPGIPSWWGSILQKDPHTVIATANQGIGKDTKNKWDDRKRIIYKEGVFLRDFEMPQAAVAADGVRQESAWDTKDLLFVGSESQAQSTIKFAYDETNLYLCVETLDEKLMQPDAAQGDCTSIYLEAGASKSQAVGASTYRVDVTPSGASLLRSAGGGWQAVDGLQAKVETDGTVNDNSDRDAGYYAELAIPWENIGGKTEKLGVAAALACNDFGGNPETVDVVTACDLGSPATWFTITAGSGSVEGTAYRPQQVQRRQAAFLDLNGHWAEKDLMDMNLEGLVNGDTQTQFLPEGQITRAEFIAIAVRALGHKPQWYNGAFGDVNGSEWYAGALQRAQELGLLDEALVQDGNIHPDQPMTREEMASVLVRSYQTVHKELAAGSVSFADTADIASWAKGYAGQAAELGFIQGDPDGSFRPADRATRAEAGVMLKRMYMALKQK